MTWRLLEKALEINVSKKKKKFNLIKKYFLKPELHRIFNSNTEIKLLLHWQFRNRYKEAKCEEFKSCNCRGKITCPLNGVCCTEDMIYKAKVEDESGPNRVYIGCTEGTFKKQWYNHRSSFRLQSHMYCTKLPQPLMGVEGKKITEAQTKWSI